MKDTEEYGGIDICKFVMACFVVAIHTNPLKNSANACLKSFFESLFSIAVPFFFLATGFLFMKKTDSSLGNSERISYLKKTIIKDIKLYVVWSIVYLPLAIWYYKTNNYSIVKSLLSYARGFVFSGEHYNSWILWYLLSAIYSLIIIVLILRFFHKLKYVYYTGYAALLLSAVLMFFSKINISEQHRIIQLFQKLILYTLGNGRIVLGLFYIPIGMLLATINLRKQLAIVLVLIGIILNTFCSFEWVDLFFIAMTAIGVFSLVSDSRKETNNLFIICRKISAVIYFIHLYVWTFYYSLVYGEKTYGIDCFAVTLLISITVAIVYFNIKKTLINKEKKSLSECIISLLKWGNK